MSADNAANKRFERRENLPETLGGDPYLAPYLTCLAERRKRADALERRLTQGRMKLADFAVAHEYYGLHRKGKTWIFREYAPHAEKIFLVGDFSSWREEERFALERAKNGAWELELPADALAPGMHYLMHVRWNGGSGERIPAYARNVEQDPATLRFSAVVPPLEHYKFRHAPPPRPEAQLIYEAHVGMAQEQPKVSTFSEFREKMLPRIAAAGYNTVQLMAIPGHPYYGSFGYHVANFYAVAGRFGTPEEFKELVDAAHGMGLRVLIDLVHSHAVKNEVEGIAAIDGFRETYFHAGPRGEHPAWDSLCFDYGKTETLHFLLSNVRFFLDEFRIDGFRFDGVTSMLYFHHGLGKAFSGYGDYFGPNVDEDAAAYLTLANRVIHAVRPDAVTIAEDVSGMPGLANPEGVGFDCRLAMGVTDLWFKLFDQPDESWSMFQLYGELTNRRRDERSIGYAECHDQALVGGQTAIFRLAGDAMYYSMHKNSGDLRIDRAVALHKLMRMATAATADCGYLNFMGNEFGHPEWIDFPREGNHWSYDHARRQWSLAEDANLRFGELKNIDRAMLDIIGKPGFYQSCVQTVRIDEEKQLIFFERGGYWFCFNFSPEGSYSDFEVEALPGSYATVLDSDAPEFGGFGRREAGQRYFTLPRSDGEKLSLYLPNRTVLVLKREE